VKVVKVLKPFYAKTHSTKMEFEQAAKNLPAHVRQSLNWVDSSFKTLGYQFHDLPSTGLTIHILASSSKYPTGGGKTLLAVEAIREYQNLFVQRKTGLIVWVVPSETIYSQTVKKLRDKSNYFAPIARPMQRRKPAHSEKGQRLTRQDIDENLVILFVMIQSVSRHDAKEALKVFSRQRRI